MKELVVDSLNEINKKGRTYFYLFMIFGIEEGNKIKIILLSACKGKKIKYFVLKKLFHLDAKIPPIISLT